MRDNTTTDDEPQPYQLTRRGLIRGAGATAIGLASLRLPEQYRPVGQAQAVPWLAAGALVGAGFLLGLGAYAGYNYLTGGNAVEVQESATEWAIYNAFEAATTSSANAIAYHADDYGVDLSSYISRSNRGDGHISPADNELMHSAVEHYTAEAAAAWSRGETLTEARQSARDAANLQLASAKWSVISLHNDAVSAAIPALSDHYDGFGHDAANYSINRVDSTSVPHIPVPVEIGLSHEQTICRPASYGGSEDAGMVGVRDISAQLPIDVDQLPEEEQPENGFKILEPVVAEVAGDTTQTVTLLSPLAELEAVPFDVVGGVDLQDSIGTSSQDTGLLVVDRESDRSLIYPMWQFAEMLAAIDEIRSRLLSQIDTAVESIYTGLEGSQIEVSDVISGRQVYQRYQPADGQSRSLVQLMSYGRLSAPEGLTQAEVLVDGQTYVGTLFVEADSTIDLATGMTLTSTDYTGAYLLPDDPAAQPQIWESGETLEIVEIYGEGDNPTLTYSPRQRYQADGPDPAQLEADLEASQQRYADLMERIEELEGSTWPFGGGGDLQNYGIVAAIAAIAALLIGR